MGFYSKAAGAAMALTIIAGSTAYLASEGNKVINYAQTMVNQYSDYYKLSVKDDIISLYQEGTDKPIMEFEIDLTSIPAADAALLQEGVHLRSMQDVMRLLEDLEIETLLQ